MFARRLRIADSLRMSTPLHIAVEYELKPDANEDDVIAGIRKFVGNISSSGLGVSYKGRPER